MKTPLLHFPKAHFFSLTFKLLSSEFNFFPMWEEKHKQVGYLSLFQVRCSAANNSHDPSLLTSYALFWLRDPLWLNSHAIRSVRLYFTVRSSNGGLISKNAFLPTRKFHINALWGWNNNSITGNELTSYDAETWRTKVNTGLIVNNFNQSHVLHIKFWLTCNLWYDILGCNL